VGGGLAVGQQVTTATNLSMDDNGMGSNGSGDPRRTNGREKKASGSGCREADRWVPPTRFKQIQISKFCSNLVRSQSDFSGLKKFEQKYWEIGFDKRKNFCYYNFFRFEFKFELKFKEDKSCLNF
jgi:hypothetical protein